MKNFKKLFALVLAVILLAGCGMKEKVGLVISSDKKISFEVKLLMDNEMIDTILSFNDGGVDETGATKTYTDADRENYIKTNLCSSTSASTTSTEFTCEMVKEGNYKGAILKIDSQDISNVTGDSTSTKLNLSDISSTTGGKLFVLDGDVYSSNLEYTPDTTTDVSQYMDQMSDYSVTLEITFPNKPISNNADEVSSDGLTLTWDLSKGTDKAIDFSFKFDGTSGSSNTNNTNNKNNTTNTNKTTTSSDDKLISNKSEGMSTTTLILIIVCSVLGLALISIIIVLLARKSQKNPVQPAPVSDTASQFGNPELANHREPKEEKTTESDSVSVSEMTNTDETEATKKDE